MKRLSNLVHSYQDLVAWRRSSRNSALSLFILRNCWNKHLRRQSSLANFSNTPRKLCHLFKTYNSQNRLIDWTQGAENTLASGEPRQIEIMRLEQQELWML